jgi:hypothetical protein
MIEVRIIILLGKRFHRPKELRFCQILQDLQQSTLEFGHVGKLVTNFEESSNHKMSTVLPSLCPQGQREPDALFP